MADAPSVLIVDRERFSTLIAKMLSSKFATDTAVDGIQTIKKLRLEVPDIMVVDQDIPGSGIRLAELIGMNRPATHCPSSSPRPCLHQIQSSGQKTPALVPTFTTPKTPAGISASSA